jgi:AhpD family alkylhydroperoxidase
MFPHVNLSKEFQAPYDAQIAFDQAAHEAAAAAGLPQLTVDLIKLRVSQINGCAFCLRMHARDAVEAGETLERIAILPAWWESQYFTPAEQAALTLAERITRISEEHTTPAPEVDVEAILSAAQIAAATWVAISMNAWNRIAISSHYPVAP